MNLRSLRFGAIGPPLAVAAVCGAALVWFDRIWIPAQQQYLNERNLRSLRTIASQIKAKVDNFDQALDHTVDSPDAKLDVKSHGADLQKYVKLFSPELEIVAFEPGDPAWKKVTRGDPPNVRILRDEGRNYVYLGYLHENTHKNRHGSVELIARGDIDKVTATLLARPDFDAIMLLDLNGATITRQSSTGLELTSIGQVRDRGQNAAPNQPGVFERMRGTTSVAVVTIGAADYMLYTQPIPLSLMHDEGEDKKSSRPEEWTLAGLVRLDHFRASSATIPTTYWLFFGAVLAFICFAIPLLKPWVLSPRERLTRADSVWIGAALFMMMALATFCALDVRTFGIMLPAAVDDHLRSVATSIVEQVRAETGAIDRQMTAFEGDDAWKRLRYEGLEPNLAQIRDTLTPHDGGADINLSPEASRISQCTPSWSCRSGVLKPLGEIEYPFFRMMVWNDDAGWQRIKWSTWAVVTPFVNISESKLSYFRALKQARRLSLSGSDVPQSGVTVVTSPNTSEKLTVFWKAIRPREQRDPAAPDLTGVTMVTTPISLTGPVLPKNLQFAVIDSSGAVQFHTEPSRSLAENMFQESEDNARFKSLVASHAAGALNARYLGRAHRFLVTPLDLTPFGNPEWSLVVFQASSVVETANLGTINLAVSMFAVHALMLAVIWTVLGLFWPDAVKTLVWPTPAKGPHYRRAALIGSAAGLICIGAIGTGISTVLLLGAVALTICALIAMFFVVHGRPASLPAAPSWQADFFGARAALLFLLSAVPAAVCFQVSYEFHDELVEKRADSQLISDLAGRARRINLQAQRVAICSESDRGSQACSQIGTFVDRRTRETLWDVDVPSIHEAPAESSSETASVPGPLRSFLKFAFRPYNDIAADLLMTSASGVNPVPDPGAPMVGADGPSPEKPAGWRFAPAIAARPPLNATPLLIAVALLGVAYVLIRYLFRPILGLDLAPAPALLDASGAPEDTSLLVIGPPGARRTQRLLRHPRARIFDVRTLLFAEDPARRTFAEQPISSAADCEHEGGTGTDWTDEFELAVSNPLTIVAISHLEHRLHDPAFRSLMLECLESAFYRHNATIWCSSSRDPLELLDELQPAVAERRGWAHVFARFRQEHIGLEVDRAGADALATSLKQHAAGLDPDMQSLIVSECEVATELLAIGENLTRRLPAKAALTSDDVLSEIEAGARHFYAAVWNACNTDERVVLRQLADEGLVNPNNPAAISHLLNIGLVRRGQTFRIMNETFRRFVLSAESHDTISTWEHEGVRVPWGTIATTGVTVAFGLAGLLLLTQEQLVDAWISYVPAVAPAIPTVWKMLAGVQKGRIEVTA